jgi:hypothetical protein
MLKEYLFAVGLAEIGFADDKAVLPFLPNLPEDLKVREPFLNHSHEQPPGVGRWLGCYSTLMDRVK